MKKHIRCDQLHESTCEKVFEGDDTQEILERVWDHINKTDDHAFRVDLIHMSNHELEAWQDRCMEIIHKNLEKDTGG